jgi:hypothetical protein
MKFDFSADETSVLLLSLIARKRIVKNILDSGESRIYRMELHTVESLLEKLFPGSVKAIELTEKVA